MDLDWDAVLTGGCYLVRALPMLGTEAGYSTSARHSIMMGQQHVLSNQNWVIDFSITVVPVKLDCCYCRKFRV